MRNGLGGRSRAAVAGLALVVGSAFGPALAQDKVVKIGVLTDQPSLLIQNIILLVINIFGIWRWLGLRARYDKGAAVATERSGG